MRILGIDHGKVRTGLAITDELGITVRPYDTLHGSKDLVERIAAIVEREKVELVVVGMPTDLLGNETDSTARVRSFLGRLRKGLDIPVVDHDEALSSQRALDEMIEAGVGRKRRSTKGEIDAWAAGIILREYVEGM